MKYETKNPFHLQYELSELFKAEGLTPSIQIKNGLIKVSCVEGDYLLTSRLVRQVFPEFSTFSFSNGFITFVKG